MWKLAILISFIFLPAFSAHAEERSRQIILDIGNDYFAGPQHTDRHLTNNISVGVIKSGLPDFASGLAENFSPSQKIFTSVSLSQYIFTPEDTEAAIPDPDDQPYAGWLFVSTSLSTREDNLLNTYGIDIGVVGPAALAAETQNLYHRLIGIDEAQGWDYQLHNELGLNAKIRQALMPYRNDDATDSDFIYFYGGSLGNVDTHLEVGSTFRWGYNIPDDMSFRATGDYDDGFSAFTVLRIVERIVFRDIFLDGNSDGQSASVEKRPLVTAGSVGAVLRYDDFEFGYSIEMSTKRFKTQSSDDTRGNLAFSYQRKF